MAGTIVCGVDDSLEGRAAAQVASALSERLDLRLVLVHALTSLPRDSQESLSKRLRMDARRVLEKIRHEAEGPGGPEVRVEFGDRVELLAQVAAEEGADLIVLGARTAGFRQQLRCSLARELEAATPVPVLIAPPQTRKRSERRLSFADGPASR